jgi:hypothetical protein
VAEFEHGIGQIELAVEFERPDARARVQQKPAALGAGRAV